MKQWYAAIEGQQYGPVDDSQLRAWLAEGRIGPGTYVWTEGMADWLPMGQVPELSGPPPVDVVAGEPVATGQRKHRGVAVLVLGIAGLVCCCVPSGAVSLICGGIAAVMGLRDLRAMRRGEMDPSGRGPTLAGMILGLGGIVLGVAQLVALLRGKPSSIGEINMPSPGG